MLSGLKSLMGGILLMSG